MEQEGTFPADVSSSTQLMLANFGEAEAAYGLGLVSRLRAAGIYAELYPDTAKVKKQMAYADAKSIQYVGLVGSDEMAAGKITLRNMVTGDQESVTEQELIDLLNV
jgi:histidyl-tRNA synthetase